MFNNSMPSYCNVIDGYKHQTTIIEGKVESNYIALIQLAMDHYSIDCIVICVQCRCVCVCVCVIRIQV